MRYGCRNLPESGSIVLPTPADKQTGKQDAVNRKARKTVRRTRPRDKETKREHVKEAAKRHHKKEALSKTNRTEYSFVYVGNIDPTITAQRLEEFFSTCGKVCRIQLRCSRGQAVSIGIPVPEGVRTTRDRQYASIEFQDYQGARNALRLDGHYVDGCELVVSITPTDLPEVQDIVHARLSEIKSRGGTNNTQQSSRQAASRALRAQPTEPIINERELCAKDRHQLFGVSFGKCVA